MKVAEKLKEAAKNNKKKMVVGGAVIFIGCAGAYAYMSKQGSGALTGSPQGQVQQGQETASSTVIKRPDRDPDIMGIVESVSGNEVKILKLDASSMPGANRNGNKSGQGNETNGPEQNADRRNMQPPADMARGGQAQSGSASGKSAQSQMLAELKKKSTGEETVIVPVGIQMLKMGGGQPGGSRPSGSSDAGGNNAKPDGNNAGSRPQQGGGEVEATISDITADKMVMIWLNTNVADRKVAEFVSIMR